MRDFRRGILMAKLDFEGPVEAATAEAKRGAA
jgi:hypothetical protein